MVLGLIAVKIVKFLKSSNTGTTRQRGLPTMVLRKKMSLKGRGPMGRIRKFFVFPRQNCWFWISKRRRTDAKW